MFNQMKRLAYKRFKSKLTTNFPLGNESIFIDILEFEEFIDNHADRAVGYFYFAECKETFIRISEYYYSIEEGMPMLSVEIMIEPKHKDFSMLKESLLWRKLNE